MLLMLAGLFLFFFVHLIPEIRGLRRYLFKRYGAESYRTWISVLSIVAMVQIIWGKATSSEIILWQPTELFRYFTLALMPVSIIMITASVIHCNIRRYVLHPLLSGVAIWAGLHLFSSGDLASIILFSFFLIFSLYKQWVLRVRWPNLYHPPLRRWTDLLVVVLGIGLSYGIYQLHPIVQSMTLFAG